MTGISPHMKEDRDTANDRNAPTAQDREFISMMVTLVMLMAGHKQEMLWQVYLKLLMLLVMQTMQQPTFLQLNCNTAESARKHGTCSHGISTIEEYVLLLLAARRASGKPTNVRHASTTFVPPVVFQLPDGEF